MSDDFKRQYLEALLNCGMTAKQLAKNLYNHCQLLKEPQTMEQCNDDVINFLYSKQS